MECRQITATQAFVYCSIAVASAAIIAISILIFRIVFPTILSYPWSMPPENSRCRKREKRMTVVFAGSFNPPHWGHLVMIRYLAERYAEETNMNVDDNINTSFRCNMLCTSRIIYLTYYSL